MTLTHNEKAKNVSVTIEFDSINTATDYFLIPRSAPGTYSISDYPSYIENISAETLEDSIIVGQRGRGSILFFRKDAIIKKVRYDVNLVQMETELTGGYQSSKIRDSYLGILGHSVFASIPGFEETPIEL